MQFACGEWFLSLCGGVSKMSCSNLFFFSNRITHPTRVLIRVVGAALKWNCATSRNPRAKRLGYWAVLSKSIRLCCPRKRPMRTLGLKRYYCMRQHANPLHRFCNRIPFFNNEAFWLFHLIPLASTFSSWIH